MLLKIKSIYNSIIQRSPLLFLNMSFQYLCVIFFKEENHTVHLGFNFKMHKFYYVKMNIFGRSSFWSDNNKEWLFNKFLLYQYFIYVTSGKLSHLPVALNGYQ